MEDDVNEELSEWKRAGDEAWALVEFLCEWPHYDPITNRNEFPSSKVPAK